MIYDFDDFTLDLRRFELSRRGELNSRVMSARKAVGDSGKEQRLIRTIHGRGFRFAGEVRATFALATPDLGGSDKQSALEEPARVYGQFQDGLETPDLVEARGLLDAFTRTP